MSIMPEQPPPVDGASSFAASWSATDTANLLPSNLPVAKVQRAWERRPQSPFSRRRVKVGKVWKRGGALPSAAGFGSSLMPSSSSSTSAFGGLGAAQQSPMKAVKKLRGAHGGAKVSGWERRGSPPRERRIVTRSNAMETDLVELGEEEAQFANGSDVDVWAQQGLDEAEVLKVEIENEDGTILELDADEAEAQCQDEDWDDESLAGEDTYDPTLMHLGELRGEDAEGHDVAERSEQTAPKSDFEQLQEIPGDSSPGLVAPAPVQDSATSADDWGLAPVMDTKSAESPAEFANSAQMPISRPALRPTAIPEGFVSPVKGRQRRTINQVRLSNANRRRTLPINFAAQNVLTEPAAPAVPEASANEDIHEPEMAPNEAENESTDLAPEHELATEASPEARESPMHMDEARPAAGPDEYTRDHEQDDEDDWEDVETEDAVQQHSTVTAPEDMQASLEGQDSETMDATTDILEFKSQTPIVSPVRQTDSPIGSIIGAHPRLPLRRSPRRQSTSPLKPNSILPSAQRSHLVAFTPIKMPIYAASSFPSTVDSPSLESMDIDEAILAPPARSSSAPPEEPQMSPRRPKQPRISDDTALLQAFLSRAAESKTSKEVSITAKRESIENRRDSGSVRQALASPEEKIVPSDVLADLDPNSPSPRKQSTAVNTAESSQSDKEHIDLDEDELALSSPTKKTFRKSGRVKHKPQSLPGSAYSAPNRISIRGTADGVVLKKSEAQELALTTRTNTRKNKTGAVLPPIRLRNMAAEGLMGKNNAGQQELDANVEHPPGRRTVKWSETLVAFQECTNEHEVSTLSDELSNADGLDAEMVGVSTAPPASETPSKPRLRRLKPPRTTASTPAAKSQEAATPAEPPTDHNPKPRATKRSSRIATPAKVKGAANSLLHVEHIEPETIAPVTKPQDDVALATSKAPVTRRKIATATAPSRLRAPVAANSSSLSASVAAAGKENSLIASPPKKRSGAVAKTMPTVAALPNMKAFAPKLDFGGKNVNAGEALGLSSPAKKKAGSKLLFAPQESIRAGREDDMSMPGLGSPAKKRSRRIGG